MDAVRALELLGGYTSGQWGMVTTRQALLIGVDDVTLHRLKTAGLLEPVRHGVHAMTSSTASPVRLEQAVWLSLRPATAAWERPKLDLDGGVVSHQSAARLHGLGDLPNTHVEMTVPRRRTMRDPGVRLHKADLKDSEVAVIDGLPLTTPIRTIRDLLHRHIDASHIATIIRQAIEAGQVQLHELPDQIGQYAHSYGAKRGNGSDLLDHLLAHLGLSIRDISAGITWQNLGKSKWSNLEKELVTWGQLAHISPEIAQRLLRREADQEPPFEPNDES
jgi:predicted transcriptional regulator of viral defense system